MTADKRNVRLLVMAGTGEDWGRTILRIDRLAERESEGHDRDRGGPMTGVAQATPKV
jgi:hypothetical protein